MRLKYGIIRFTFFLTLILSFETSVLAQKTHDVYVDKNGVMRWGDSKMEVYGFGVNYTAPFAHAYRSAKKLGVDLEKAIEQDVYHFSRLGFDAFRVHVWDTEISDTIGNVLDNEHLRLFDFMLMKMKERGMKMILTPIAFWSNGYPEDDEKTPGFAAKYGKDACLVDPLAIAAQEKYLFHFLNHMNAYTKIAYKDDPNIVGFEVSNEPHHRGTKDEVKTYINRMVSSMRRTGCRKPIFYNISHGIQRFDAYAESDIDGGTFQWYPTGLGAGHELRGNFLPNVDQYTIPYAADHRFKKMAKIVYEFDAADIGRSYIYPAMARSFREAGIQWATHFAYDPTFMAHANTEYNTHYMNLVYAPQKALSLKIASEVFHRVPLYTKHGIYPGNMSFENFRVSYLEDLAEMATDKKFIYTNNTLTVPPDVNTLEEISGFGSSPVVKYPGKGAYFLDRIEKGVWRLEVLPDAIWVKNVFGRNSLQRPVAVISSRAWPMEINLADLGENFTASALTGEMQPVNIRERVLEVKPGVYLLRKAGVVSGVTGETKWKEIKIGEFAAPANTLSKDYVLHDPFYRATAGQPIDIKATVVTAAEPVSVIMFVDRGGRRLEIPMYRTAGYEYAATIPAQMVETGFVSYSLTVDTGSGSWTYPAGEKISPDDWDFDGTAYKVPVVPATAPLYIFNAKTDTEQVNKPWSKGSKLVPCGDPSKAQMIVDVASLSVTDSENPAAPVIKDYSMRYNFQPKLKQKTVVNSFRKIVLRGKSLNKELPLQISLIDKQGRAFGATIQLSTEIGDVSVDLNRLKPVKLVLLPRPYPTFLPYYFEGSIAEEFDLDSVETVQISIGSGLANPDEGFVLAIESIRLE